MTYVDDYKGALIHLVNNCICAFTELCKVKNSLINKNTSTIDFINLGSMHRVLLDYLIIRVAGLFDKTENKIKGGKDLVVSFEKFFSGNNEYEKIKKEQIVQYIIEQRNNFVAHFNVNYAADNWPDSAYIIDSNLGSILNDLHKLLA